MSRNLATRLAVAVVAIPAILWICYQGGFWLLGLLLLLALVAMAEFLHNEKIGPAHPLAWIAFAAVIIALMGSAIPLLKGSSTQVVTAIPGLILLPVIIGALLLTSLVNSIGKEPPEKLFRRTTTVFWMIAYVALLYPIVFLLGEISRVLPEGSYDGGDCLLFLFGLLWVGDTAAMGFGKWLGRRKLAPAVSPNKTVAGFVGGLAGALAVGVLMAYWKFEFMSWYHVLAIAVGSSLFGQLGDLVESMWKRSLSIKDSSALIPGHGGVLDRFDSLLFAAPFMFIYLILVAP